VDISEIHHATRVPAAANGRWYARYWLGELFPDSEYDVWRKHGNLQAGRGGYIRKEFLKASPDFGFDRRRRTDRFGAPAFFNSTGQRDGPFSHLFQNRNVARATRDGEELGARFNLNTPGTMSAFRPFTLDATRNYPPEWGEAEYAKRRLTMSERRVLYDATRPRYASSSALVELSDSRRASSAFFVMNGLSPAGVSGTAFMARYAAITLIQGFMTAGEGGVRVGRVPQLPRVEITAPAEDKELIDPDTIEVEWELTWKRWDGQPYTRYYSEAFQETTPVFYAVLFSTDGGRSWRSAVDGQPARTGERPGRSRLVTGNRIDWKVSDMPAGDFLLRVEAYRDGIPLHYSYHVVRQNIRRL
jgi:hypothetical protein